MEHPMRDDKSDDTADDADLVVLVTIIVVAVIVLVIAKVYSYFGFSPMLLFGLVPYLVGGLFLDSQIYEDQQRWRPTLTMMVLWAPRALYVWAKPPIKTALDYEPLDTAQRFRLRWPRPPRTPESTNQTMG